MEDDDFALTFEMFRFLFLDLHNFTLWFPSFILAALLRVITHKYHNQLIFPACELKPPISLSHILTFSIDFIVIPFVFYFVVLAGRFNIQDLRESGWIFTTGGAHDPWYKFYTMFGSSTAFQPVSTRCTYRPIRFESRSMGPLLGHNAYSASFVSLYSFTSVATLTPHIRLFFNILHPPLNVPALCAFHQPFSYFALKPEPYLHSCFVGLGC